MYAFIINNQVKELRYSLPTVWENISNFNNASKEIQEREGWYQVEEQEGFDSRWHVWNKPVIENGIVKRTYKDRPLDEVKANEINNISSQVRSYVYSHYDDGTQKSLLSLRVTSTSAKNKKKIDSVWAWIQGQVLAYYYQQKTAIEQASTVDEIRRIVKTVDFHQFDATDPGVSLADLL